MELDYPELVDLSEFVQHRERDQVLWANQHELMAEILEVLDAILKRLGAGIPVTMVKGLSKPKKTEPVKRPPWVEKARSDEQVVTPRELFARVRR
ncbi:hypothetical protein [uncultured Citricoccus sp.]|uniref:hypothetical protein n=1 Tax=uncultured Citricoccus sp. TaxID=614031 RepID=UPI00261F380D|nr:hypothetical protein [uncultured Citricoccus sp.]